MKATVILIMTLATQMALGAGNINGPDTGIKMCFAEDAMVATDNNLLTMINFEVSVVQEAVDRGLIVEGSNSSGFLTSNFIIHFPESGPAVAGNNYQLASNDDGQAHLAVYNTGDGAMVILYFFDGEQVSNVMIKELDLSGCGL